MRAHTLKTPWPLKRPTQTGLGPSARTPTDRGTCGFGEGVVGSDRHSGGQSLRTPSAVVAFFEHQNSTIHGAYAYFQPSCGKRCNLCMDHNATKLLSCRGRRNFFPCFPPARRAGRRRAARCDAPIHAGDGIVACTGGSARFRPCVRSDEL